MNLNIDLLEQKKSTIRTIFGVLIVIFSFSYLFYNFNSQQSIDFFDWIFFAGYLLLGLAHLLEGTGTSIMKKLGAKAHILIDNEKIAFKPETFKKETRIKWKDIKSIEYKAAKYKISLINSDYLELDLPTTNYNLVQVIKESINAKSKEFHIPIT
jgi:5-hydroxyisourate hydrolase-like protein (transthyretin family)